MSKKGEKLNSLFAIVLGLDTQSSARRFERTSCFEILLLGPVPQDCHLEDRRACGFRHEGILLRGESACSSAGEHGNQCEKS